MSPSLPALADAQNKFEDLSGVNIAAYANPYDALIEATQDDPAQMQAGYSTHRTTRNAQQKDKLLSPSFAGLILDPILQRLADPTIQPGFTDPRHCLVFWARPPSHIRDIVDRVQQELLTLAPKLWLMPLQNLHLTALEITHSLTQEQINDIISTIGPETVEKMTDYTLTHRARLIKPMISYDGAALALSFLPAAGESLPANSQKEDGEQRTQEDDKFTYHHLRKELFDIATSRVKVDSRYVVPSSHITIGRFLTQEDHEGEGKLKQFLEKIEVINEWLEAEFWSKEGEDRDEKKEWLVGMEKGLDCREGRLWYGGGRTVRLGRGF